MAMRKGTAGVWKSGVLRVLVDMDGVLADFDGHFLKCFREQYPKEPFVPLEERKHFYLSDDYKALEDSSPGILMKIRKIYEQEGFVRNLPPIKGSLEALKDMSSIDNVEVFLCTSPLTKTKGAHYDVYEKIGWVEEHLGQDWVLKMIITKDKTMVHGNVLIDDKHRIKGSMKRPSWDHIIFTDVHNSLLTLDKSTAVARLDSWTDGKWQELIQEYLTKVV